MVMMFPVDGASAARKGRDCERVRQEGPARDPLGGLHGSRGRRQDARRTRRRDQLQGQTGRRP